MIQGIGRASIVSTKHRLTKREVFILIHTCPFCARGIAVPLEENETLPTEGYCHACDRTFDLEYKEQE